MTFIEVMTGKVVVTLEEHWWSKLYALLNRIYYNPKSLWHNSQTSGW